VYGNLVTAPAHYADVRRCLGPLRSHPLVGRRRGWPPWAVLPVGAAAGTMSLLAVLVAGLSALAAASERAGPPDDGVDWAEMEEFLPGGATLEQAVGKIRRARIVTSALISYSGRSSPVYEAYLHVARVATVEQLRTLLMDESPAVRVYAFCAFADRQPNAVWHAALLARVDDVELVPTLDGCIYDRHTVFERMLEHVEHRLSLAQSKGLRELHERMKHGSRPLRT
jgi:hypothetical protein